MAPADDTPGKDTREATQLETAVAETASDAVMADNGSGPRPADARAARTGSEPQPAGSSATESRAQLMQEVGAELSELRQAADSLDEAVATLYGLNRTDLRCLGILYRRGRVTAGELAEESGLTPGAITTALDRMERGGYANRVADPEDRRRVLVLSTVAAREVGARIYGEVEVASQRILDRCSADELTAIRDYLRGARQVYEGQTAQIVAGMAAPQAATGAMAGDTAESSAPLAGAGSARLEFNRGADRVNITADAALEELYTARFEGPAPSVLVRGNSVIIEQKRRFRPFDWRGQTSDLSLNAGVPWAISLRFGLSRLSADLRGLQVESLEVSGGASEVEVWLPSPVGNVPVRLSGGASKVIIHRPAGSAIRADMSGGASHLAFDGTRLGSLGGRNHFESPGSNEAVDRYDLKFTGGASQIVIDTV
jgi:DNA-binding MarR family transcriptional regulator